MRCGSSVCNFGVDWGVGKLKLKFPVQDAFILTLRSMLEELLNTFFYGPCVLTVSRTAKCCHNNSDAHASGPHMLKISYMALHLARMSLLSIAPNIAVIMELMLPSISGTRVPDMQ